MSELLSVKDVALKLKTNTHYVYSLIHSGLLPALKIGSWKVRTEALDEFLKKYEYYDLSDLNNIYKYKVVISNEQSTNSIPISE